MSFLRLWALWALPLILLPILIHLIHRRRHPTVPWAAMRFLQHATESKRGPAKLQRWLILLVRTLIVTMIVLALARPLSSSLFGFAASRVAESGTTIVLLDRSPSMQFRVRSGDSRQTAGLKTIAGALQTVGVSNLVLVDSVAVEPVELNQVDALLAPTLTRGADSTADIPAMLLSAMDYLDTANEDVADIWICSDRQTIDWDLASSGWEKVRERSVRRGDATRFNILEYDDSQSPNQSIQITDVSLVETEQGRAVTLSAEVLSSTNESGVTTAQVLVDGITRSFEIPYSNGRGRVDDVEAGTMRRQEGMWGMVSISSDINPGDNRWYFLAEGTKTRRIGLMSAKRCSALEATAESLGDLRQIRVMSSEPGQAGDELFGNLDPLDQDFACVLWQGQLPSGADALKLQRYLRRGGSVLFFPPAFPASDVRFQGLSWGEWNQGELNPVTFDEWEFPVSSHCQFNGEYSVVASLGSSSAFIARMQVGRGSIWICGGNVLDHDSRFVGDGLALVGIVSDALQSSGLDLRNPESEIAGETQRKQLRLLGENRIEQLLPIEKSAGTSVPLGHGAGLFEIRLPEGADPTSAETRYRVINREGGESNQTLVSLDQIRDQVPSLDWYSVPVHGDADSNVEPVREIWGVLWGLMIVGMLVEACLSMPRKMRGVIQ